MRTIADDARKPDLGTPTPKAALRAMLQAAVLNTGGVPAEGVTIPPQAPETAPRPSQRDQEPVQSLHDVVTVSREPDKRTGMWPTADDVARAIVAAANESKENPTAIASGGARLSRGRHYAMHALIAVFPGIPRMSIARMVGALGNSRKYWENSRHSVRGPEGPRASWWNELSFKRVVDAIRRGG